MVITGALAGNGAESLPADSTDATCTLPLSRCSGMAASSVAMPSPAITAVRPTSVQARALADVIVYASQMHSPATASPA